MKSVGGASLRAQGLLLRRQMQAQRARIAEQIDVSATRRSGYPRSLTMRFLAQRPAVAMRLAVELGTVLLGTRFIRSLLAAKRLVGAVRSA